MSLSERLNEPVQPRQGGRTCGVSKLLSYLTDEDRKALETALKLESGWAHTTLCATLADEGHHLSVSALKRHRLGICACDRA